MSRPLKDTCKSCSSCIEACLQQDNVQEHKCLQALEDMHQCCIRWHKCNGIDLKQSCSPKKSETKINK
ncbi:hypothetical protein KR093_002265 [Drosophila rubida]|uniref:Cx9C motif-containing protein 4 n=1 Tax=Drosophila rubida TaxID=30044 RepID=A0AAD4JVV5_9MUSC|nr:hypothetical protein KR093_002265 [Drosophila rubida]